MHDKLFYAPIAVRVGGADLQIVSLADMNELLSTWPESRRGELYNLAVKAHETAEHGYITMDQARRALVALAEATGVLRSEVESGLAARAVARGYGGFAA